MPDPFVKRLEPSYRTLHGGRPYIYATKCGKCSSAVDETSAWEALRWKWHDDEKRYRRHRVLLCGSCGPRAKSFYEKK